MTKKVIPVILAFFAGALLITVGNRCTSTKKTTEVSAVDTIFTNINGKGISIELTFLKGASYNHPLMAIWLEDNDGRYIETLYVAESIGKGIFRHADKSKGFWEPGPIRRPAALPYWGHKRGIQAEDGYYIPTPENPMPDAVTGPTPTGDFVLYSKSLQKISHQFCILLEINQSWDWNKFWTNDKYPGDENYKTSSQPAIVYKANIDLDSDQKEYTMVPIGYSHYSGQDESLTSDLSTLTTALKIVSSIKIQL